MKPRRIFAVAGFIILSACTSLVEVPQDILTVGSKNAPERETVVVRAVFFHKAYKDIEGADCTVRGPGYSTKFKSPRNISVPVKASGNPEVHLSCSTVLGAAVRHSSGVMKPIPEEKRKPANKDRVYPSKFAVLFQ